MTQARLTFEEFSSFFYAGITFLCIEKLSELENRPTEEIIGEVYQSFIDCFKNTDFEQTARESNDRDLAANHIRFGTYLTSKKKESKNDLDKQTS